MNTPTAAISAELPAVARPAPLMAARRWSGVYMDLAKARLSTLVVITAAVGFLLASRGRIDWMVLGWTIVGTALSAWSANSMNQIVERDRDARMPRTSRRPLPSARIGVAHAAAFSVLCGIGGVALLAWLVNPLTAALSALTIAIYVGIYTPMKTRTTANTLVGSVVGAIPPLMGWSAATGTIEPGAWVLAALLFIWQMPHFLALAWLFRDDYVLGGYRMLPIIDPTGSITSRTSAMWTLALLPIGVVSMMVGVTGVWCAAGSLVLGVWMLRHAVALCRARDAACARRLFLASIAYLPLLMALMVVDRTADDRAAVAVTRSGVAHLTAIGSARRP